MQQRHFYNYIKNNLADWGFQLCGYGYYFSPKNKSYPPSGHPASHNFTWEEGRILNGYYIVYIPSGSGVFETRALKQNVYAGDAIFIYDKEWHRYKPNKNSGWEEYWIGFKGQLIDEHIEQDLYAEGKSYIKKIGYQDNVIQLFNYLMEFSDNSDTLLKKVGLGVLLQILAFFTENVENITHTNRHKHIVDLTISQIRNNLNKEVDFKELASSYQLSYSRFRKIFKDVTNIAPHQFLLNERLESAKRLLINTDLSVKKISDKLGFNSVFYFSKLFKNKTGKAPSQYRR